MTSLKLAAVCAAGLALACPLHADEQRFSVAEDSLVRLKASLTGITRISVVGDRIASIVNDDATSVFQVRNDAQTGDLYLKYVGAEETPAKEGGYLVTEQGRTVAYELLPVRSETQTALITIKGAEPETGRGFETDGFTGTVQGAGDGLAARLTAVTRETIQAKIRTAEPGGGSDGTLIASQRVGDLTGELRVAAAGKAPRMVREQDFFRTGVLSVWVQKKSLAAGERSWVVVVRGR